MMVMMLMTKLAAAEAAVEFRQVNEFQVQVVAHPWVQPQWFFGPCLCARARL